MGCAELRANFRVINDKKSLGIKPTNVCCCLVDDGPQRYTETKHFKSAKLNDKFAFLDSKGFIIMSKSEAKDNIDDNIDRKKDFSFYVRIDELDGYELFTETIDDYNAKLDSEIYESLSKSSKERLARIKNKSKILKRFTITIKIFDRDADIIAETLYNANGSCGCCNHEAPFLRVRGLRVGTPYLEVHHIKSLADGGEDSLENTIALCPNCHRKAHYG